MRDSFTRRQFVGAALKCAGVCAVCAGAAALPGCSGLRALTGGSSGSGSGSGSGASGTSPTATPSADPADVPGYTLTPGTQLYQDFTLDNVLSSNTMDDIHFHIYVPPEYDGQTSVPLFVTLPGQDGLLTAGVGQNLFTEDFARAARDINPGMIIVAPQFSDAEQPSAILGVALVQYLLNAYNIDRGHVYIEGYDGGGQTMSIMLERQPTLFCAGLFCASKWDGSLDLVVSAQLPLYLTAPAADEVYGADPETTTAARLREYYTIRGCSEALIADLVVCDVKDADYFAGEGSTGVASADAGGEGAAGAAATDAAATSAGAQTQHAAFANLVANDADIMNWLFSH